MTSRGDLAMNRRQLKNEVLTLLQKTTIDDILPQLAKYPLQSLVNPLFIALCHREARVRWNAVFCFGWVVSTIAEKDLEAARIVMRRFLWSLNDESGGIGWGAPEAMAEIMCHNSILRHEYLHMLISYMREDGEELFADGNYLELPLLQRGLLWGVGRLCQEHRGEMIEHGVVDDIRAYLRSPDMHVAVLALWCLGLLGVAVKGKEAQTLLECPDTIELFLDKEITQVSPAELASRVLPGK